MTVSYNFATAWESIADAQPEVRALVQGDRVVSWGDFDDRAARLAQGLLDRGVAQGAKVASYLYNSNEYMEGVFATWKLRGAPVNVNYRYLEDELLYLVDNSDAEVLLFHGVLAEHVVVRLLHRVGAGERKIHLRQPLLDRLLRHEDHFIAADTRGIEDGGIGTGVRIAVTVRVRGVAHTEELKNGKEQIVLTELPYNVRPERVIEAIKKLVQAKKLQGISDVTDLTDRNNGLRLIIELKTGFDPQSVLELLYRYTPLEDSFSINNVALVNGRPQTLGLRDLLGVYLAHQIGRAHV